MEAEMICPDCSLRGDLCICDDWISIEKELGFENDENIK
jgi:hypothetical protein